jgi:hypothetical protein
MRAQGVCDDAYLASLPIPSVPIISQRVVQIINCTDQVLLGATNAPFRIGEPPYPVFPREKTWVMQPFNPNNWKDYSNILTIDIPEQWENAVGKTKHPANAPNIWARTGCRYDIVNNRAVCETGGCSDAYDCPSAGYSASDFTTITEWTFHQKSSNPAVFIDHADISAVNGTSLTVDVQGVGGDDRNPFGLDWLWLRYNGHLSAYGEDLRNPTYCGSAGWAQQGFLLKRSDIDKSGHLMGGLKFEIIDENGDLACLKNQDQNACNIQKTDFALGCLSNCGYYEFPAASLPGCSQDDPKCVGWEVFCAGDPKFYPPRGTTCTTDQDCADYAQKQGAGPNGVYASCWYNNSNNKKGFCSARAFFAQDISNCDTLKDDMGHYWGAPTSMVPCSYPFQAYNDLTKMVDWSTQPPYEMCSDVKVNGNPIACVGDDTIHRVLHGGYTWPNDPQTFDGDSPVYRIIYGPQAKNSITIPITPAAPALPLCSDMPDNYRYTDNYSQCSIPIEHEGAVFGVAVANLNDQGKYISNGKDWACSLNQRGAAPSQGVTCRWHAFDSELNCTPPMLDDDVTGSACGRIDEGTSLISSEITPTQGEPLFLQVSVPKVLNSVNPPATPIGCASNWQLVAGGSLTMFADQGYLAWYQATANTDQPCQVTVTLANSNPAELKLYAVPKFNGTVETASSLAGSFVFPPKNALLLNSASAGVTSTQKQNGEYLMLGSLLQVNQQLTPITYWNNWLTNNLFYPAVDCIPNDTFCPTDDGTDYLPGHGKLSANSDVGHQHITGAGAHTMQRAGQNLGSFNWGGVAIYLQLNTDKGEKLAQAEK